MAAGQPLQRVTLTDALVTLLGKPLVLTGGEIYNADAATRFVQLFDATSSASVTLGTTPSYRHIAVSAGDNEQVNAGDGIYFERGIVAAATTGPTNATGATAVHVSLVIR